jgi:hypothetical protein
VVVTSRNADLYAGEPAHDAEFAWAVVVGLLPPQGRFSRGIGWDDSIKNPEEVRKSFYFPFWG